MLIYIYDNILWKINVKTYLQCHRNGIVVTSWSISFPFRILMHMRWFTLHYDSYPFTTLSLEEFCNGTGKHIPHFIKITMQYTRCVEQCNIHVYVFVLKEINYFERSTKKHSLSYPVGNLIAPKVHRIRCCDPNVNHRIRSNVTESIVLFGYKSSMQNNGEQCV